MNTPKVSVITPAYNATDRIAEIGRIVNGQKYTNIEHIVVNDGSSDQTDVMLEDMARKWDHLRAVNQPNQGRSAARNRGVSESSGDYLLFLDDDDAIDENAISEMVNTAVQNPGAVVHSGWKMQLGSGLTRRTRVNLRNGAVFETTAISCPFVIHGCLVPRLVMEEANGFDESLDFAEDWDLWQRFGRAGVPFVGLPKPLATYNLLQRDLPSDTAHIQYQQARLVIQRAFDSDDRVENALPEFRNGCPVGRPEKGMISCLAWFAGIEYAQGADFPWLSDCVAEISRHTDYTPDCELLASAFSAGILYGRGLGALDVSAPEFPRLQALAAEFDLDDPSALVPRQSMPISFPLAISEVQHCQVSIRSTALPDKQSAGRIQPWLKFKGVHHRIPAGVYATGDEMSELKFNLPKGIALATLDLLRDRQFVRSLPTKLVAMAKQRSLIKRAIFDLAGSSVDRAVQGSMLPKLDLPTIKSAPTSAPEGEFDRIFATEDPWGYDKAYEVRKYEETLELLSDLSGDDVVTEMSCAEGHFTARLAPLVKKVRAYDLSPVALQRLENRLQQAGITNVETARFDLLSDRLSEQCDVLICSEVLYYMPPDRLDEVVHLLVAALRDGGTFVHAHAFEASQRGTKPGFGWRKPFGVQRISEAFGSHPELQRCRVIETDLYKVERYEKKTDAVVTNHEFRAIDRDRLEPEIANQVLWKGYRTTPAEADQLCTTELPVLTYHSISHNAPSALKRYQVSPGDFAEQLGWLRENGYRSAMPWEVSALVRRGRPISGKAVLITFDDAYQCFADNAWPLLQNHGFGAVMFACSSFMGDAARWDARFGEPMKIMDGQLLAELAADGLCVGSHSTDHQPMTYVSTAEALDAMLQSKRELQNLIHKKVDLFAYPFGLVDPQVARLAKYCGYSLAFAVSDSNIKPFDNPHTLNRLIVDGSMPPLTSFESLPEHQRRSAIRHSLDRSRRSVARSKWAPQIRKLLNR